MNWYFSINESGFNVAFELIKVAVNSARSNTSLNPICLYAGEDASQIDSLERLGVEVISHTPSFSEYLKIGYGQKYETFKGHWLRCDIPLLDRSEEALYTDIDVMFLKCPVDLLRASGPVKFIGAAPEISKDNFSYFNSGVLYMNLDGLREILPAFHDSIKTRLTSDFKYPAHDQASFNSFFLDEVIWLPNELNWKPYWGSNDDAAIVHFHGPKPRQVKKFQANDFDNAKEGLIRLWRKNPSSYQRYVSLYERFS